MNADNTFLGSYLKVQRANAHLKDFINICQPLDQGLYEIKWIDAVGLPCFMSYASVVNDNSGNVKELAFLPKGPIAMILAAIIGDIVHNLRASLDYAATAVVRAANQSTRFVTFPFHEERDSLVAEQSAGIRQIQAALPGSDVQAFFQNIIRPYRSGNFDLWCLTKLDKIDKHNFLIPVVAVSLLNAPYFSGNSSGVNFININSEYQGDASIPFAFLRMNVSNGFPLYEDLQISSKILFQDDSPFAGSEIIPTLSNILNVVVQALQDFEKFCVDAGLYERAIPVGNSGTV